jgi:hypothetical protein
MSAVNRVLDPLAEADQQTSSLQSILSLKYTASTGVPAYHFFKLARKVHSRYRQPELTGEKIQF